LAGVGLHCDVLLLCEWAGRGGKKARLFEVGV
jgi:hypothetical protein